MDNLQKFLRFFCACAPGIAIGFWIAQKLGFFWPIGAIIGASLSYLLVEWRVVVLAIPKAYDKATSWQPDKELWRYRGLAVIAFLSVISSCAVLFLGVIWLDSHVVLGFFSGKPISAIPKTPLFFVIAGGFAIAVSTFLTMCMWLFVMLSFLIKRNSTTGVFKEDELGKMFREGIKFGNPLAVFFYLPIKGLWNLPKGVRWIWKMAIWKFCLFFGRFLKELLFNIHSQKRVLCATTTFISVASGYMVDGSLVTFTIIGAVAGGLYSISPWRNWVLVKTNLN